jgi:hypothetical protein
MDMLNNIDPNANPSTHSTVTFIYNTFATKMPKLLVLLITHTSGLLMCKFLFAIWKSLILMTQMPSHFYTLPAAESKSDLQVMGLSTLDLQFV